MPQQRASEAQQCLWKSSIKFLKTQNMIILIVSDEKEHQATTLYNAELAVTDVKRHS